MVATFVTTYRRSILNRKLRKEEREKKEKEKEV